jgi:hypothetical protein
MADVEPGATVSTMRVAALVLVLACSRGGGDEQPQRCAVRVTADAITVDGTTLARDAVVERCKQAAAANVAIEDGGEAAWRELRAGLQAVGVKIYVRGELWDGKDPPPSPSIAPQDPLTPSQPQPQPRPPVPPPPPP